MAFQVFNLETYPGSKPTSHFSKSGNQILACPAAVGVPNDDWLISPELNFKEAFTFSFWAKSYSSSTSTYDEKIEVAYSTTGKLATDFTTVVATEHVTDKLAWANFEDTIPANAK